MHSKLWDLAHNIGLVMTKSICFKLEIKVFLVSDYSQLTAAGASLVTGAIVPRIAEEETRPKPEGSWGGIRTEFAGRPAKDWTMTKLEMNFETDFCGGFAVVRGRKEVEERTKNKD